MTESYGAFVHHDDFASAWFELLQNLYDHGKPVAPRGFETHELLAVKLQVSNLRNCGLIHPARGLNYRFSVAEWLWIAAGRADLATLAKYNKWMAEFSDDGITLAGAYGSRLTTQMDYMLAQLHKPGSRQAVATLWTTAPAFSRDIPCTISWQLLARDGVLHAIVNMRSSDIWLGLPYDFYNFAQLTNGVAGELGLDCGSLTFNLGSSHLYDRDREKASAVLLQPGLLDHFSSPRLPGRPPADDILNLKSDLLQPWAVYRDALEAKTSADALTCLRTLA